MMLCIELLHRKIKATNGNYFAVMLLKIVLLIISFIACFAGLNLEGKAQVIVVSILCSSLNLLFIKVLNRFDSWYLVYKFFVFFYVLQPFFFLLLILFYPELTEQACNITSLFNGRAFTLLYSFSLVPAIALICIVCTLPFRQIKDRFNGIDFYKYTAGDQIGYLLFIGALINTSIWVEPLMPPLIGYCIRVVHATFTMTSLLAGYYWSRSYLVRLSWLGSLGIGLFFAMITGSRAHALWPLIFYVIGFLSQLKGRQRVIGITLFIASLLPGFFFLGFIHNLRDEIGRNDLSKVNIYEVINYVPTAFEKNLKLGDDETHVQLEASAGYKGLQRMVDWTLVFAPNMTPNPVEYRGYNDYMQEIKGMLAVGGANMSSGSGSFYPTELFARNYGFPVHLTVDGAGRFASHTVPFGILADSWSRYGLLSSILQITAALVFFVIIEYLNRRVLWRHPDIAIMGFAVLAKYALQFATVYSLTSTIRRTIVFWIFGIVVCFFLKFFYVRFSDFPGGKRRFKSPSFSL